MIKEDYVSFETAKLLKEKGFDANTEHDMWYVVEKFSTGCHWNSCTYKVGDITREYDEKCCIVMPTLQMAMKWLRNVHNIHITMAVENNGNYIGYLYNTNGANIQGWDKRLSKKSYEEACEAAIKYTLENLI